MVNDSKFVNPRHKLYGSGFGHSGLNSDLGTENHVVALSVVLHDPWSSYKTAEKEDIEEQKRNEEKIHQKDPSKPENQGEDGFNAAKTSPNKAPSEKDQKGDPTQKDPAAQKKKKAVFDDYTEIYKILLKNKQDKIKENENKDKNSENQDNTIRAFAMEANLTSQKLTGEQANQRRDTYNDKKHYPSNNITLQHLVHFFECSPKHKHSKHHFKASMLL